MIKLTKNNQKIIIFLGDYPERKFFGKEIAQRLDISLGGAHNALKYLAKEKIIREEQKGNMKFYQINEENPLVRQIKATATIKKLLPLVSQLKGLSKEIILFGSAARGEQTFASDIDLFILTHQPDEIKGKIAGYKRKTPLKPIILTPNQWSEMEIKEPEFYREVRQGIKLL